MLSEVNPRPLALIEAAAARPPPGAFADQAIATPAPRFVTASLALELGILLGLSVLFPFMIHVLPVPEEARLGPRLLPIFYAPLLAALLGRKRSAISVAILAPWLNWLVTGYPRPQTAWVTTLQLLVFVLVLHALLGRLGARPYLAVPAYLAAMLAATALVAIYPPLVGGQPAGVWAVRGVIVGLPGIAILVFINWLVVRAYPSDGGGNGPAVA